MKSKLYLEGVSEDTKEELLFLYNLGIEINELEFLVQTKINETLFLKS